MNIQQKHEDCHYETAILKEGLPIVVEYGTTQEEADTKALNKFNQ